MFELQPDGTGVDSLDCFVFSSNDVLFCFFTDSVITVTDLIPLQTNSTESGSF